MKDKTENKSVYRYLDCHMLEQECELTGLLFITFWLQKTNITVMT